MRIFVGVASVLFIAAFAYGWIANIVQLFSHSLNDGMTIELTMRLVGVFVAPVGAVLGYIW